MKRYILLLFLLPLLAITGCERYLDIKPAGKLIPQKGDVQAFGNLLNNTSTISGYKDNNSYFYPAFLTDDLEMSDIQADYVWKDGSANMHCYFAHIFQQPYGNPNTSDYFWNVATYKPVLFFNNIINGVKGVITPETEAVGNEIIAQATVSRAYCYLMATMIYGPVYRPGGDNSRKTIPYRTTPGVMDPMDDLSTQEEVFEKVLSDIHTSLPHMTDLPVSNTIFGKVQAYALLAYYHLFTAKPDSVALYADKALTLAAAQRGGMENLIYDYNLFSWTDPKIAEDPDLRYGGRIDTPQGGFAVNTSDQIELCIYREGGWRGGGDYYNYPSSEYIALFDAETDLRREYVYFELDGNSVVVGKDTLSDGRRIFGMDRWLDCLRFTDGFSYPEVLLMRAEGRARTGNLAGALEDLNYLRKMRHKTGTPPINITGQDNVIMEVLNERRRELPIASTKRFFDLKRFCLETGKPWCKTEVTHIVKGVKYTQKIDSEYFIIPISNEVLKWNPQWGIPLEETLWTNSKKK